MGWTQEVLRHEQGRGECICLDLAPVITDHGTGPFRALDAPNPILRCLDRPTEDRPLEPVAVEHEVAQFVAHRETCPPLPALGLGPIDPDLPQTGEQESRYIPIDLPVQARGKVHFVGHPDLQAEGVLDDGLDRYREGLAVPDELGYATQDLVGDPLDLGITWRWVACRKVGQPRTSPEPMNSSSTQSADAEEGVCIDADVSPNSPAAGSGEKRANTSWEVSPGPGIASTMP